MLKEFTENKEILINSLLGTIFADGSICKARNKSYKDKAYLEITHTSKNLDYLEFKKTLLEKLPDVTCKIVQHNKKTENKQYLLFRLVTNSTSEFRYIRDNIYTIKDNLRIKKFPKEYIYRFNDLSLYLLYLDDGTIRIRYKEGSNKLREARISFCLNSFKLNEIIDFKNFLKEKYNIDSKYYKFRNTKYGDNTGFVLWLNTFNSRKFLEIIDKFYELVPSMKYKFLKYGSL